MTHLTLAAHEDARTTREKGREREREREEREKEADDERRIGRRRKGG